MAYKLNLPTDARIHDIFHFSPLKSAYANIQASPLLQHHFQASPINPKVIIDRKLVKKGNAYAIKLLVQWQEGAKAKIIEENMIVELHI